MHSNKNVTTNWKMGKAHSRRGVDTEFESSDSVYCLCVRVFDYCMPCCTSVHSSITPRKQFCSLMKPQGPMRTYKHRFWTSSTVALVEVNLKTPKKFSSKHTDEDQVVLFICDSSSPQAWLISSRATKAYGCGFSNSPRAHNKSLKGASDLGNVSYTGAHSLPAFRLWLWEERRERNRRSGCHVIAGPPPQIRSVWLGSVHGKDMPSKTPSIPTFRLF